MGLIGETVSFLIPPVCAICGRPADGQKRIPGLVPDGVNICTGCISSFVPSRSDRRWFLCLSEPYSGDIIPDLTLYMPFEYDSFMQRMIHVIKFGRREEIARFAGMMLGRLMTADGITEEMFDLIVPVPLSEQRLRERGFNQAGEISRGVSGITGIPCAHDALIRIRNTGRQAELAYGSMRSENISGAFRVNDISAVKGKSVILIDDVATTGNTLHEAALMLSEKGVSKVVCVAVCGNRIVKNAEPF